MRTIRCLMAAAALCACSGTAEARGPLGRLFDKLTGRGCQQQAPACYAPVAAPTFHFNRPPQATPQYTPAPVITAGFSSPTCPNGQCPKR